MRAVLRMMLDPWRPGVSSGAEPLGDTDFVYREVDWPAVPDQRDRVMVANTPVRWRGVENRSFRLDGILLVNLCPGWDRDEPLPDGWSTRAPWEPRPASGNAGFDSQWHFYPEDSAARGSDRFAERRVCKFEPGVLPNELLTLSWWASVPVDRNSTLTPGGWCATLDHRIIGYRTGTRDDPPPTAWADECLAGCYYEGEGTDRKFVWANGSRWDDV